MMNIKDEALEQKYKIFCCTHIPTDVFDQDIYEPLQTGVLFDGDRIENMRGDDCGDNISAQKDIYDGLLTGMYWIWKNTDYDVVGVCHYHRYLGVPDRFGKILQYEDLKNIFEIKRYDICVFEDHLEGQVEQSFYIGHQSFYYNRLYDPLDEVRISMKRLFPQYIEAYDYSLKLELINSRHVFIMRKNYYDEYCAWLFAILKDVEESLRSKNYCFPSRFFGYLAERMERAWLIMQDAKILSCPIISLDGKC